MQHFGSALALCLLLGCNLPRLMPGRGCFKQWSQVQIKEKVMDEELGHCAAKSENETVGACFQAWLRMHHLLQSKNPAGRRVGSMRKAGNKQKLGTSKVQWTLIRACG